MKKFTGAKEKHIIKIDVELPKWRKDTIPEEEKLDQKKEEEKLGKRLPGNSAEILKDLGWMKKEK